MNRHEEDERIRSICLKAQAAQSDEDFDAAMQELRDASREAMSRARDRIEKLGFLDALEKSKSA